MRALALAVLLLVTGCESIKGYIEDRAMAESIPKARSSQCASDEDKASLDSLIFEAMR